MTFQIFGSFVTFCSNSLVLQKVTKDTKKCEDGDQKNWLVIRLKSNDGLTGLETRPTIRANRYYANKPSIGSD